MDMQTKHRAVPPVPRADATDTAAAVGTVGHTPGWFRASADGEWLHIADECHATFHYDSPTCDILLPRFAEHAAAAWNACDGMTTAQLDALGPGGVAALVEALRKMTAACENIPNRLAQEWCEDHGDADAQRRALDDARVFAKHTIGPVFDTARALLAKLA